MSTIGGNNIQFSKFDPFSFFKYQRAFWGDECSMGKKIFLCYAVATAIILKTSHYFLPTKTNLLLPRTYSANQDNALFLAIAWTAFTTVGGFIVYQDKKMHLKERVTRLETEIKNIIKYYLPERE